MSEIIQNKNKWYKCHYRIIGVSLIIILLLLIVGHIITYNLINNQKEKSKDVISQILINASKEKSLIPDLILIEANGSIQNKKELNDSLKIAVIDYISTKYSQENSKNSVFNISPYILNNEIKSEEKIIKHIEFLNSTVTKAVEDSKNQIDTEISKLNTWISIWIGVIGFLGIFFPLIINIRSLDELKELKEILASSKAKVDSINDTITGHETTLITLNSKTQNIENILKAIKLISKLKDIDDKFIIYNKAPSKFVAKTLEELKKELDSIKFIENELVIKDVLHQLSYRLYTLSTYSFVQKNTMDEMLKISDYIISTLDKLSETEYNIILKRVMSLTVKLDQNGVA